MRLHTINIRQNLDQLSECKNLKVEFDIPEGSCAGIKCEATKKGGVWSITVSYPDDCNDCVYAIVTCDDECDICDQIERIRICPCVDDVDCEDCHVCSEDNICVSLCEEDEFCDDDECVECNDDNPCPGGKECDNGKCVCPPGTFENSKGVCVECDIDNPCPDCGRCINGECVDRVCDDPTRVIDPETCLCEECYNDAHCTEPNECCDDDNECNCCDGFIRDDQGDCVLEPECVFDEDCADCNECNDGDCVDKVMPTDHLCVDDKPVPECNCANPDCDTDANCVPHPTEDACYCKECEGTCDENVDCGPGCYCDNGVCRKNPCYGTCVDGPCPNGCGCDGVNCYPCDSLDCDDCDSLEGCECTDGVNCSSKDCYGECDDENDCGPGCGCYNNECIDCSTLDCDDCDFAYGCGCNDEGECEKSPCSGECEDGDDCGSGCGCQEERCEECNKVSCGDDDDCPHGCLCDEETNKCKENPCSQTTCETGADCGPNCGCDDGECKPCDSFSCAECENISGCTCEGGSGCEKDPDNECTDEFNIEVGECDATFSLDKEECCKCDTIGSGFEIKNATSASYDIEITLRKGDFTDETSFLNNDLLGSTGVENELPDDGKMKLIFTSKYAPVDVDGNYIAGPNLETFDNASVDFTGVDTASITGIDYKPLGTIISKSGGKYKLISYTIDFQLTRDLKFPNDCKYSKNKTRVASYTTSDITNEHVNEVRVIKEVTCRKPLLELYRHTDADVFTSGTVFKTIYADSVTLTEYAEGLHPFKYYGIDSDCGCAKKKVYDCNGDNVADPLVFCNPKDIEFDLKSCGTIVELTKDIIIDCDIYLDSPVKPNYSLYINGKLAELVIGGADAQKVLPGNGILWTATTQFVLDPAEVVETVELRIDEDSCNKCNITGEGEYEVLEAGIGFGDNICSDQTNFEIDYFITGGKAPYDVTISKDGVTTPYMHDETGVTEGSHSFSVAYGSGGAGVYEITVTDADGCQVVESKTYVDLSPEDNAEIETSCDDNSISVKNIGYSTMTVSIPNHGIKTLNTGQTKKWVGLDPGTYALTVVISSECSFTENVVIDCCKTVEGLEIIPVQDGSNVVFYFQNNSPGNLSVEITDNTSSATETIAINEGAGGVSSSYPSANDISFEITSTDGTACTPVTDYYEYDSDDLCKNFDDNVKLNKDVCYNLEQTYSVLNPTAIDIVVEEGGNSVYSGTGSYNGSIENGTPVLVKVTSNVNGSCTKSMVINPDCCNSADIEIVEEDCLGGTSTVKFNYITTASQNGNPLSVSNNEISFNPDNGDIVVGYVGKGCNKSKTFSFECCNIDSIEMTNKECNTPNPGETRLTFNAISVAKLISVGNSDTVYTPDGSGRIVVPSNLIEDTNESYLDVDYNDGSCSTSRRFQQSSMTCCECESNEDQMLSQAQSELAYNLFNGATGGTMNIQVNIGGTIYSDTINIEPNPTAIATVVQMWLKNLNVVIDAHVFVNTYGGTNSIVTRIEACDEVVNISYDFQNLPFTTYNNFSCQPKLA